MKKRNNHLSVYTASPKHLDVIKQAAKEHHLEPTVSGYMKPWVAEISKLIESGISSEFFATHRDSIHDHLKDLEEHFYDRRED